MSIVRFNPWRDLDRVEARRWAPPVDIWETPEAFRIEMDLPAVDPADVDVSIRDGLLVISGERKRVEPAENERGHRHERRHGEFRRSFRLPETVDADSIVARVNHGVLEVTIGKRAEVKPRRIEVVAA